MISDIDFIGLDFLKAVELAVERDLDYRTVKENGKNYIITRDYRSYRLNSEVEQDVIIGVSRG